MPLPNEPEPVLPEHRLRLPDREAADLRREFGELTEIARIRELRMPRPHLCNGLRNSLLLSPVESIDCI